MNVVGHAIEGLVSIIEKPKVQQSTQRGAQDARPSSGVSHAPLHDDGDEVGAGELCDAVGELVATVVQGIPAIHL